MKNIKTDENQFWKEINNNQLSYEKIEEEFPHFKSSSINHKIALFNPKVNGVRYLKTLIYLMASELNKTEWNFLSAIHKRETGSPISIKYKNEVVCLDYLQAINELSFISSCISLNDLNILEIGAGYGRTAHSIISNFKIKQYTIIDLGNALELAKKYLKIVLSDNQYKKITFIDVNDFVLLSTKKFDLAINIDSFAEMDKEVVLEYLKFIKLKCKNFYVKNPVGKYLDKTLDGHSQGKNVIELALKQGLLTNIVDIDNQYEIQHASKKFLDIYRPGESWQVANDLWAKPFSYLWQAMYCNKK